MDREQYDIITRSLDQDLSEKDQVALDALLQNSEEARIELRRMKALRKELRVLNRVDFSSDFESAILEKINTKKTSKSRLSLISLKTISMAATVALLMGAGMVFWANSSVSHIAPFGESIAINLPEGSQITLAPGSELSYPRVMFNERRVELSGQAYFNVATDKAKPFIVESFNAEVEVTGTEFDVNTFSAEEGTKVYVSEGSVKVRPRDGSVSSEVSLNPGQRTIVRNDMDALVVTNTDSGDKILSWKTGGLMFDKAAMSEVMASLSRLYDLKFVKTSSDILERRLTYYEKSPESAEQVLNAISHALGLKYIKTTEGIEFVQPDQN